MVAVTREQHPFFSSPITNDPFPLQPVMDAPQLVFVPATPLPSPIGPISASSDPPPVPKTPRRSTETAIVSIYSMYGDQELEGWTSAPLVPVVRRKKSTHARPLPTPPTTTEAMEALDDDHGHDFSYYSSKLDSPDPLPPSYPGIPTVDHTQLAATVSHSTSADSRPHSRQSAVSSSVQTTFETASVGRSSTESKPDSSLTPSPSVTGVDNYPSGRARSRSPRKRQPAPLRKSVYAHMELPPVPTSSDHLAPSRPQTPQRTPPSSRPATPSKRSLSPGNVSRAPSPASKLSQTPPGGEDADALLVRSTYALLDAQGVKGDGYEEGVERTRAKIGPSEASQRDAALAIADESEKKRELTNQEILMLGNLDR